MRYRSHRATTRSPPAARVSQRVSKVSGSFGTRLERTCMSTSIRGVGDHLSPNVGSALFTGDSACEFCYKTSQQDMALAGVLPSIGESLAPTR